jgi:hypothetical protein
VDELIKKMIHQSPEERPDIGEVSSQLKISQFGAYRTTLTNQQQQAR